jgi:integrase/predicted RNA-binding Zn-ribbon protein involved in translation (DUF1610 family)
MAGHIRRRGSRGSWEFIIDIGPRRAQRCAACGKRFWVERRALERCPSCGGELTERDERCRRTQAGFRTRRECEQAMSKALAALSEQKLVLPSRITVRDFLMNEWLPVVKINLRPTTAASYESLSVWHIIPRLGSLPLQRLSAAHINSLYAYLLDEGRVRTHAGLSASSVRRVHAVLHRTCRDAVRWGILSVSPADGADPPKVTASPDQRTVWSAEQLSAFLTSVADDRLSALWRLLCLTGMRRGEALGLRWEDLDMEQGTVTVRRALVPVNGVARVSEPKTRNSRRTIALDEETLLALQAHAARQADEQAAAEPSWNEAGYVFVREDGEPLVPYKVTKAFRDLARKAALPPIRLHDLRHSYATLALASGVHPRVVSARLGHSTVALTLDVYSHVLPQHDQAAAQAIARLL